MNYISWTWKHTWETQPSYLANLGCSNLNVWWQSKSFKWMENGWRFSTRKWSVDTRKIPDLTSPRLVYLGIWPIELRDFPTKTFAAAGISQPCLMTPKSSTRHADHAEHLFADCRAWTMSRNSEATGNAEQREVFLRVEKSMLDMW